MENLFKKVAVFTDLHLGLKSNSLTHNKDCEEFIDWFIKIAKENNCETGMFLGDFHHNRNTLNVVTMDFSLRILEKLGKAFDQFFYFPGNHDLYYKDKRDIHSVEFGKYIPGITIIHHPTTIGNVTLCPWLVGDEWKQIGKKGAKYIFGHFELPSFFMNAMVQMPDHGELQLENFNEYELGFSGHFHKRQVRGNMHYIGNAFPHNYADTWDDDRGMMMLAWGGSPEYKSWPNQPTFRTITLSKLIDTADEILKPKQHLRVINDCDLSFEEAAFTKDHYISKYNLREITLISDKKSVDNISNVEIETFESIDSIVSNQLINIDSETFNKNTLLEIYNDL